MEGWCHCLLPAPRVVWLVAYSHKCNKVFCGVRCCGRGGFETRLYGMGKVRSGTRPYGTRRGTCPYAMRMVRGGANTCLGHAIDVCGW